MCRTTWLALAHAESQRLYSKDNLSVADTHELLEWHRFGFSVREAVDFTFATNDELFEDDVHTLNLGDERAELELA